MRILLRDLSPGTTYQLQLRAADGSGSASEWSRIFGLTTTADLIAPNTPAGVAGSQSGSSFQLSWSPVTTSSDGTPAHDLDRYEVKVESTGTGTNAVYAVKDVKFLFDLDMNRTIFGVPRANIRMSVRAVDAVGNASAYSSIIDQTNAAPANPANFTAVGVQDAIIVKWDAVADTDLTGYKVYSGTTAGTQATLVWQGPATSATLPSTLYSSDRWYKVAAVDVFGTESVTPPVAGPVRPSSPFTVDTVAPAVPTSLAATLTNATDGKTAQAAVSWTATPDTDGDLAGYQLGYKVSADADWQYTTVDYTLTSTLIKGLLPYVNYDFRIRAYDWAANYSAWSSTLTKTATTNAAPAIPTGLAIVAGRDDVRVSWTANSEPDMAYGAGVYDVTISTSSSFASGNLQYRTGADNISVTGLASGTIYYARVRATDSGGLSSAYATAVNATTGIAASAFKYTTAASAPSSPTTGDIWMDSGTGFEKQWSGSAWVNTGNASINYITSKATDLVTNGNGLMGSNYNFPNTTFTTSDSPPASGGAFRTPANSNPIITSELMPVDPNKSFKMSLMAKQTGTDTTARCYAGLGPYDINGLTIIPQQFMFQPNTTTTLAVDLVPGATTVQLTSAANWNNAAGANTYLRGFIFWNYTDRNGKNWGDRSYSRENILNAYADGAISGNTITLNAPWAGFVDAANPNVRTTIPAGTPVSNSSSSGTYMYMPTLTNVVIPSAWTNYTATFSGTMPTGSGITVQNGMTTSFPPGTAYAKIVIIPNRDAAGAYVTNSFHSYGNISFSDASAAQDTATTALASANGKNKVIHSTSTASGTTGFVTGDTWMQYDGSNNVIAQWRYTGSAWQSEQVGSAVIANLDAGKLTANSAFVTTLNVGTGGVIQSAGYTGGGTSGFQLSTAGLTIKGTGNVIDASVLKGGTITGTTINVGASGILNIDSTAVVKSNNYAVNSTGYQLTNTSLEINDGSIDAKALRTATAIIGDLTIGRSADALGTIKSFDYAAGVTGWKIGKGLFEINQGLIKAAALQIQNSQNIMPPAYADFEYGDFWYLNSFWNVRGQGNTYVTGGLVSANTQTGSFDPPRFGKQYFGASTVGNTAPITFGLCATATDYNVPVDPSTNYILSWYARNNTTSAVTWTCNVVGSNAATLATTNMVFAGGALTGAWTRYTLVVPVPSSGVTALNVQFTSSTVVAKDVHLDGVQIEMQEAGLQTASPWTPPGMTSISPSGITTGLLRSSNNIQVGGITQPAWSLNTAGNLQVGDALVRGKLIVGTGDESLPNKAPGNGDFETNVTGYSVFQGGATSTAIVRTTTGGEVISGTGSAKVTAAAGAKAALGLSFSTPQVYQPGTTVTVSGNVKVNTTDAASGIVVAVWNSSVAQADAVIVVPSPVANTVYSFTYQYVVPSGQDIASIVINHGTGTATSVIFDDIVLTADVELAASVMQSANFQSGAGGSGWQVDGQGNVEFNQGFFRGTLGASTVTTESLSSTITMSSTFRTGSSGKRVEFNSDGIVVYKADETPAVILPSDPERNASFDGDLLASSLTISDQLAIRGTNNEISKGANVTLAGGTTSPSSPPTVTVDWNTVTAGGYNDGFGPYRWGMVKQGGWWRIPVSLYGTGVVIESYDLNTAAKQYGSLTTTQMWVSSSMTAIGNNVYMIGTDKSGAWRLMGWTFSTAVSGTPTLLFNVAYQKNADHYNLGLGHDGTNLLVTYSSNINLYVGYYTHSATTGARIGTFTVSPDLKMAGAMTSIYKGTFGGVYGGATVFIVTNVNYQYGYVLNSSFARLTKYDFPLVAKPTAQFWDGTKLYTYEHSGGRITEHTDIVWDSTLTGYGTWHAANTWYDRDLTPLTTVTNTTKALTTNVATITTSAVHGFTTGQTVVVAGVDATFNGTYTIASTPTTTTFTYAKTAANVTSTAATGTSGISSGVHETTIGPIKSFSMKQRARLTIQSPPIPIRPLPNTVDDATAAGVYIARNVSAPARTKFERIEYLVDNIRSGTYTAISPFPTPGVDASQPPPSTSNFPASSPGIIRSANDKFILNGDGSGIWGSVDSSINVDVNGVMTFDDASWIAPTLGNSWVNYGSGHRTAGYRKLMNGIVELRGLIKLGTTATTIFTLPSNMWPLQQEIFSVMSNTANARVDVLPTGVVQVQSYDTGGSNAFVSLAGIRFDTS